VFSLTNFSPRYVYQCRAGRLPASAYLRTRLGGTKAAYFQNAARIVLERYAENWRTFDWAQHVDAPRMLVKVLTLAANYCAYLPDQVFLPAVHKLGKFLKRPLESFDYARVRKAGMSLN
jgi:hypothetical protein